MYQSRRQSMGAIERKGTACANPFPRRNSAIVTKCSSPKRLSQSRRHSELSFQDIQKLYKPDTEKKSLQRQFSVICSPKEISSRQTDLKTSCSRGIKAEPRFSANDLVLPRIPSATPEPDVVKHASQHEVHLDADGILYKPKHCWCFRCQIMYGMYKNGDERLAMWGNYPCFRR